ncbi:hypothetical protein NQ317_005469 [Molorchus minor]|uniref:RNase H type-1 domain-containing protein n=1 Tax=Molorchus minor TaxID=1323400 RepID=A0ABQ9J048_9CUCU|nr:hypothetical protein NQ317_005469 [Molorchus minor]
MACGLENVKGSKWRICPDSQAALLAIESRKVKSGLVFEWKRTLNDLASRNRVILTWVQGHLGVRRNKKADLLAKEWSAMYPSDLTYSAFIVISTVGQPGCHHYGTSNYHDYNLLDAFLKKTQKTRNITNSHRATDRDGNDLEAFKLCLILRIQGQVTKDTHAPTGEGRMASGQRDKHTSCSNV